MLNAVEPTVDQAIGDIRELTIAETQLVSGAVIGGPIIVRGIILLPLSGPLPTIVYPTIPDIPSAPDFGFEPDPMPIAG